MCGNALYLQRATRVHLNHFIGVDSLGEQIAPHEHVQERFVEQSVYVVVPPIMEGISAVGQITPNEHVQERIVEQSVYVCRASDYGGISAVEQITPHVQVQEKPRRTRV